MLIYYTPNIAGLQYKEVLLQKKCFPVAGKTLKTGKKVYIIRKIS